MSRHRPTIYCLLFVLCGPLLSACNSSAEKPTDPPQAETPEPVTAEPPFELEEGFVFLANHEDMSEFTVPVGDAATWSVEGHTIRCGGHPRGYLATKKSYRNFTLRLDFRYERPKTLKDDDKFKGNTGFMMYINNDKTPWPACIEVQGNYIQLAKIVAIGGADAIEATDNEEARIKHRKPAGQWNSLEIQSQDGALLSILNGVKIAESGPGPLTEGPIGFQAEDWKVDFRNVRIQEN